MSAHGPTDPGTSPRIDDDVHETVGAYALGLLEPAEASAFEEHLAGCDRCAGHLEELVGLGPVLAALADVPEAEAAPDAPGSPAPDPTPAPEAGPVSGERPVSAERPVVPARRGAQERRVSGRRRPPAAPSGRLAEGLMGAVAAERGRRRRRARLMVASAAALIVAGPLAALGLSGGNGAGGADGVGGAGQSLQSESAALAQMPEKVQATDAATKVNATLGLKNTPWGTNTVLELKNVKGPERCSLAAVGEDGSRQTMTSWTVPYSGYGIPDSKEPAGKLPLYVRGTAALDLNRIDHFEVRTLDGKHLVTVRAPHPSSS